MIIAKLSFSIFWEKNHQKISIPSSKENTLGSVLKVFIFLNQHNYVELLI
jgi:hypothetical protein